MAGSKNTRKKTVSAAELARRKAVSHRAWANRNQTEHFKNLEREHYIGQFREMNEPMTERRLDHALVPLEKAIYDIEATGEGTVDPKGDYLFQPYGDRLWYSLTRAIAKSCDVYGQIGVGPADGVDGLRRLAKRLELHMPLFAEDMAGARAAFAAMRAAIRTLTPNQLIELVQRVDPDDDEEPTTPASPK